MKRTSGELLEFEELKRLVGRYVAGPLGRAELDRLLPVTIARTSRARSPKWRKQSILFVQMDACHLADWWTATSRYARLRIEGAA